MRLALACALSCIAFTAEADPVVVELFTAQGCSSCPPADSLLGELVGREDVLPLSFHVDYWDWIGWPDTFAEPEFTVRQRNYARVIGSSLVYTPQFVIGGQDQIAGPSGMKLADSVQAHRSVARDILHVASTPNGPQLIAAATGQPGRIMVVDYLPEATVRILHGENAGREITYHNVVRGWYLLAEWDGGDLTVELPAPADGDLERAVVAQAFNDGKPGAILGAARVD